MVEQMEIDNGGGAARALQPQIHNIVVQNMRNNDRRERITALIDRINGNPFPAHINDIAALRKLTNFELRSIRFTHNNVNILINGGTC